MPNSISHKLVPVKHDELTPFCRLRPGETWHDPLGRHSIGCGDCTDSEFMARLSYGLPRATIAVQDPPYNFVVFDSRTVDEYILWSERWLAICENLLADDSSLYIWLGADQDNHFQPLPQFMQLMAQRGVFQS